MYAELGGLLDALHLVHEAAAVGNSCESDFCMGCTHPTAIDRVHSRDRVQWCMQFTD